MALWSILLAFLGVVCVAIYLYCKYKFRFWDKYGIIHTNPSIPLGDMSGLGKVPIGEIVSKVYRDFPNEKFVGLWFFTMPTLLIRDPELIKTILVRDFMNFHDRGVDVNEEDDPLSAHLFSIGGSKWRNLRVKLSPTFTSGKMKAMFPILVECSKQLKSVLDEPAQKGEVIDVKDYAARFTTDIISSCAFGFETDCLHKPDSDFRKYGRKLFEPNMVQLFEAFAIAVFPKICKYLGILTTPRDVTKFFMGTLRDNIDYRKKNNIRRKDFLDLLIQLMDKGIIDDVDKDAADQSKSEQTFTFEQAAAQAFVFFLAGFETSSTTMQFALYELALNPDIQKDVRNEVNATLMKHKNEISYECINEMEYLARVIDETLRKYPAVPNLQRQCNKDYKIPDSDAIIPKGIVAQIDVQGLHWDPQYFPDPERFIPDRFTEEEKAKRHQYVYLPFGEGPRNCIGMRFGLMQTKIGLVTLLSNYEFEISKESPVPLKYDPMSFITAPIGGMHLKIKKLNQL